ncbi:MAG: hypothetical protein M1825_006020 [Sarcosagium campestre]|nr:MAG: hypothetical protein M1825_006020 [Sarcosagium campestre]
MVLQGPGPQQTHENPNLKSERPPAERRRSLSAPQPALGHCPRVRVSSTREIPSPPGPFDFPYADLTRTPAFEISQSPMVACASQTWSEFEHIPEYFQERTMTEEQAEPGSNSFGVSIEDASCQARLVDGPPFVYHFPQDYCQLGADPSYRRLLPQELRVVPHAQNPVSEAYPPSSYLMDPQKHQPYMTDSCRHLEAGILLDDSENATNDTPPHGEDDAVRNDALARFSPGLRSSMVQERAELPAETSVASTEASEPHSPARMDEDHADVEEAPYAKLIYRALISAPGHKMVLKEIYDWFAHHTDKNRDPSQRGWQNSIRHNLSMNGAFRKVEHDQHSEESKKGFVWVLDPTAIQDGGVKSTTRYRKTGPNKKHRKSDPPATHRQVSGRRGGQASRKGKSGRARRANKGPAPDMSAGQGIEFRPQPGSGVQKPLAGAQQHPATLQRASEGDHGYAYFLQPSMEPTSEAREPSFSYRFQDVVGVTDPYNNDPLFCESPETCESSVMTDYPINGSIAEPYYMLASLALASPRPQQLDIDAIVDAPDPATTGPAVDAVSEPPTYDPAAAKEAAAVPLSRRRLQQRGSACDVEPDGYGPKPPTDSPSSFLAYPVFEETATGAPTPQGYSRSFSNLQGSTEGNGYLGLTTFRTYDTIKCAQACDASSGCSGFNIYFERDPTVNPGPACPNPAAFTNIKCTLWGLPVVDDTATNQGQYRGPEDSDGQSFHVVIAGSNGYSRASPPAAIPGFDGPTRLGGAINAPLDNGVDTYLGQKYFNAPYDPSVCASACVAQTAYNKRHPTDGTYKPCNFFTAYVISQDNAPQGLYCALYTRSWGPQYATNTGQYRGTSFFSVSNAYSYTLDPLDEGRI